MFMIQVNCVVMRGFNDDELPAFVSLTRHLPINVRFIEFMPFDGNVWSHKRLVPYAEMLATLVREVLQLCALQALPWLDPHLKMKQARNMSLWWSWCSAQQLAACIGSCVRHFGSLAVGQVGNWCSCTVFSSGSLYGCVLRLQQRHFPGLQRQHDHPSDTAKNFSLPGHAGSVSFITSMTNHFCAGCNRLRLLADGNFKVCLFGPNEVRERPSHQPLDSADRDGMKVEGAPCPCPVATSRRSFFPALSLCLLLTGEFAGGATKWCL